MSREQALQHTMRNVPMCVAVGYVDMSTGVLLDVHTTDSRPEETLAAISAATASLFQGGSVITMERMFRSGHGISGESNHDFQEIIVFSEHFLHIFMRGKRNPMHAAMIVCTKANVGIVLTKARLALSSLEASQPIAETAQPILEAAQPETAQPEAVQPVLEAAQSQAPSPVAQLRQASIH
ncbi:MAG: hypothetical protein AAFS10_08985 [Myxococcota bacterium]